MRRTSFPSLALFGLFTALGPGVALALDYNASVPMRDKGVSTYYVQGIIDGYGGAEFMVDTGSAYMTINEMTLTALERSGQARFVKKLSGIMADGSRRTVPVYSLSRVVIGETCEFHDVEAAVLPGSTRLILGLSALKRAAPFAFSVDPPALMLSNCSAESV